MRTVFAAAVLAAATTAAGSATAAPPLVVTLTAASHHPRVGVRWPYAVRATRSGRPVAGRITAQIVDPLGMAHPVELGTSTRTIVGLRFDGVFRDFIIWPASSRGIPLTLRVTVSVSGAKRVARYTVTPTR